MANRFWVGGTGTWDGTTTTNWSTTSGGAGGASAPTATDNTFFDASSGGGVVSIASSAATCLNWDSTGYTGSFAGGSGTATIKGNVTVGTGVTAMGFFSMAPDTGVTTTLTTNGKSLASWVVNAAGTGVVQLADALTMPGATLTLSAGTFVTNNFAMSMGLFGSSNGAVRTLSLGSSAVTLTSGSSNAWNTSTSTNFTMTTNTAVVTFSQNNAGLNGASLYNYQGMSVVFVGSGTLTCTSGTYANITRTGTASKTDGFVLTNTTTVTGTLTITGNSATNRILVQSNVVGSQRTINAATVVISNVDFMDIVGAGAANWNLSAITGGSGDAGGNSGITFTTPVTRYAVAAGNWSSTTMWGTASGGASGASVPLPQDTVVFDANSAAGSYVNDMPRFGKDITFAGFTRTFTQNTNSATLFGSLTLSSGMTLGGTSGFTFQGRGTHTITTNGKTMPNGIAVTAPGATYTMTDALTTAAAFTLNNGTFDTGGFAFSCLTFTSTGTATRAITLGTSTVSLTSTNGGSLFWQVTTTGLTISAASASIVLASATSNNTRIFAGGSGVTYGSLTYTVASSTGSMQVQNGSTFGTITVGGGTRTLQFTIGTTTTITGSLNLLGTSTAGITLNTQTAGSAATISMSVGTTKVIADYVTVQDITGTGGATFTMGSRSTNVSGNTGLSFTDASQRYWVGGTATWDATAGTKWAVFSGGTGGLAVPTSSDDVYFDATSGSGTVTATGGGVATCNGLFCTGFTGTLTGGTILIAGSLALSTGGTYTGVAVHMAPAASTAVTVTSLGKIMTSMQVTASAASSSVTLADALSLSGGLTHNNGPFVTNSFAVVCGAFASNNSNVRTLTLGSSSVTVTGTGTAWTMATSTNLTVTATTSTITFTGSAVTVNFGGKTFGTVVLSGGGNPQLQNSNTFANLTVNGVASKTDGLSLTGNQTVTNVLTISSNSSTNRLLIASSVLGTPRTLTAANVVISNTVDFMDITGAGAATWTVAGTGATALGDAGGNSGITFTAAVTQTRTGAGGNWSDVANWTSRVPLPQDDVIVAAAATGTISVDMPRLGASLNFTGFTGTWARATNFSWYGSLTLDSGMTLTAPGSITAAGRGSHTIDSAGKSIPHSLTVQGPGCTYTLASALTVGSTVNFQVLAGSFVSNNFAISCGVFVSTGTLTRSITLGTSTVSLTSTAATTVWNISSTAFTISAASSTIVIATASALTRFFVTGGATFFYGTLTYTVAASTGVLSLSGGNANFTTINVSGGARTLTLAAGNPTTVSNWNVFGTAGNLVTVNSSTPGSQATLSKSSGIVSTDYLSIQDSAATGGANWYAGSNSVNVSNNSGWIFSTNTNVTGGFMTFFR